MAKIPSLIAVACVVMISPLAAYAAETQAPAQAEKPNAPALVESMVLNPGFEEGAKPGLPYGWQRWPADMPPEYFTTTDEDPAGGKLCLKYDLTNFKYSPELSGKYMDDGREYLDQTGPSFVVDMAKATRYRLTYWYKADKTEKNALYLYFAVYGADGKVFDYRGSMPKGTGKWEQTTTEFTLPPGSTTLRIGVRGFLGSKIYLDNIALEPVTEAGI